MSGQDNVSPLSGSPLAAHELARWRGLRKRLDRRFRIGAAGIILFGLSALFSPTPLLVWNASASAPIGLYGVRPMAKPARGEMVLATLSAPWEQFAAARQYLPAKVPLVKRVAATEGDIVCAVGPVILINNKPIVGRLSHDSKGRFLPWWDGCHQLRASEVFLLMQSNASSFDGRYFGMTHAENLLGSATLLWAK